MIEFEEIRLQIYFTEGVRDDRLKYDSIFKYSLSELIKEHLQRFAIQKQEVRVEMVTIEKNINEIKHEESNFRIVKTKFCNALLQRKITNNFKNPEGGFIWKDVAWFSSGTEEQCLENAKKEIARIKTKKAYREFVEGKKEDYAPSDENKRQYKKRSKTDRMTDRQRDIIRRLLEDTGDTNQEADAPREGEPQASPVANDNGSNTDKSP